MQCAFNNCDIKSWQPYGNSDMHELVYYIIISLAILTIVLLCVPCIMLRVPCGGADPEMEAIWCPCEDLGVIKVEKGMLDDHMPNEVVKAFKHVYQQLVEPVKEDGTANQQPSQPTYNQLVTNEDSPDEVNNTMLY